MNKKHKIMILAAILGFLLMVIGVLIDFNDGLTGVFCLVGFVIFMLGPVAVEEEYRDYE